MIQSIYTSVSNADIVPCGKKGDKIKTDPIPLLRNNYLGEYRTALEKAKVRANLGIANDVVLEWKNISGHIEENDALREAFSYKLPDDLKEIIKEDFNTIKGALTWALEYISTFVSDTESIAWLREQVGLITSDLNNLEETLNLSIETSNTNISNIQSTIQTFEENISNIDSSIVEINSKILELNEGLSLIDTNTENWIKNHTSNSILLNENLEVKISELEGNALLVDETGLYVSDLSELVNESTENIENLQTNVNTILDTYVTKELLGGGDFNFVDLNDFDNYVSQTNQKLTQVDTELAKTVKTGEDGHVDTLYVNKLSKSNEGNILITDSLEVTSGVPLDIRTVVKSSEELYKLSPNTAYIGMTVANIADGNIYMLVDKANIDNKSGWKASYESILIIACTSKEYEEWLENTTEDFLPKDETLSFIHLNTYYYIYEDEDNQLYYVTKDLIEEWLDSKAAVGTVDLLITNLENTQTDLANYKQEITENYSTSEQIALIYYNKEEINSNHYTKEEVDLIFVTKESLRGDSLEGEDDFVFVTQNLYNSDKEAFEIYKESVKEELDNTLKVGEGGILDSISVNQIKSSDGTLIVEVTSEGLSIDNDPIVTESDLTKHVTLSKTEYEELVKEGNVDADTYYFTYEKELSDGFVTQTDLSSYCTITKFEETIAKMQDTIDSLTERIAALEAL